jgi:hypothetical protein
MTWLWITVFIAVCTAFMIAWVWTVERETDRDND